jgi:NADP-dependent 3-hydroxy acid dehydrogenase YdfG
VTAPTPSPRLAGRTALVTGASRGIGAAVARRLASEGARVALLARSEDALRRLAAEIGGEAIALPCDVRSADAVARAMETLLRLTDGGPDIVVNNAGAFLIAPAEETSVDAFRETLEVNLTAPFALVRAVLPAMRARGRGHVVTIGSIADRAIFPGNAAYAASKFGLRALHEVLRNELRGSGVRATLVSPGPVDTELWDAIDPDNQPGFTPRASMLSADAVADAVHYVVTAPATMNVDELRLSRS